LTSNKRLAKLLNIGGCNRHCSTSGWRIYAWIP
jgi:hypothetical protein